jgi:hypothetical protein
MERGEGMTKLTRRGAFGAAAGGAVAAASMKAEAEQWRTPTVGAPEAYDRDYNAKTVNPMENKEWVARQLAEARRIAAGDFDDIHGVEKLGGCPYAPLQSVSEAAKSVMRERRSRRMWRENRIKRAVEALKQYDATGVINTLF